MTTISDNLQAVRDRISTAARKFNRDPSSIKLLAVSKTKPPDAIREAYAASQLSFGENYAQEGLNKIASLADLNAEWHFIGPLQSNKTQRIAEAFDWVHSLDRLKIAQRLSEQRPSSLQPLQLCIQVNVSEEHTKGGVSVDELEALARQLVGLSGLRLRGLMAIPALSDNFLEQRRAFCRLRECFERLIALGFNLDTLSMGMSDDLEAAVAEGSTLLRVGSAIFGER